jgi:hypothetical protein
LSWASKKQSKEIALMFKRVFIVVALLTLIVSCASSHIPTHHEVNRCEAKYSYLSQTGYDINVSQYTSKNIAVDTSGLNINLSKIDRLTNEVEDCLKNIFGNPPILPDDIVKNGECVGKTFDFPIRRECLVVKVADDWFLSKYEYGGTHHQQLPWTNGGQCTNKGLPAGVCYYRVGIQDNLTIVVPPSFYLYKDGLVRVVTGCHNPWYAESLANCMNPSTDPLGDGSEP